jgi:hypothetical protein
MNSKSSPSVWPTACLCAALATASYGAGVSPSKFELRAQPGEVLRDTVRILNPGEQAEEFALKTADWRLNDNGGVQFVEDVLLEDSCRPWVRLERRTVSIQAGAEKNYRFEVHVPADAAPGLCRFAIIIEPTEPHVARIGEGGISVPMVARFAVVTYVTIGDAAADVAVVDVGTRQFEGQRLPTVTLQNLGNTYDRAFGDLIATDFRGQRTRLVPSEFPVLPGRSEVIQLRLDMSAEQAEAYTLMYPLRLSGRIEIGGKVLEIDEVLE